MNNMIELFPHAGIAAKTWGGVLVLIGKVPMKATRRRDLISDINRFCAMTGQSPAFAATDVGLIRQQLSKINAAAHGISGQRLSNIIASLRATLAMAGVIDGAKPGRWKADPAWYALLTRGALTQRLSAGLASFASYCAANEIAPGDVTDDTVLSYHSWLTHRTIADGPDAKVRLVPRLINEARDQYGDWPIRELSDVTVGLLPLKTAWVDLPDQFRNEADAWLSSRQNPDPFDEKEDRPSRPIAASTAALQREHIRLAWNILNEKGLAPQTLAELVEINRFKTVLRHYHEKADGKPSAFAVTAAVTIRSIARYYVKASPDHLAQLKRVASRLPAIQHDLTEKNKVLLQAFEDETTLAKLLKLPNMLMTEAMHRMTNGLRYPEVPAQAALAIAILTAAPMRSQNLIALESRQHLIEKGGKSSPMKILIPKTQTKTKHQDLIFCLDPDTADLIRFYRSKILPFLGADPHGTLFVCRSGKRLGQTALAANIANAIRNHLGINMTPHQFRHLAAFIYLRIHPEDFETVRQLLGHSFGKTTLVYAGLSGERSSNSYKAVLLSEYDRLREKGMAKGRRRDKSKAAKGTDAASSEATVQTKPAREQKRRGGRS